MILHESDKYKIEQDTLGNYTLTAKEQGASVYLQSEDDKDIFREELKNYNRFDALCENYEIAMERNKP